MDTGELARRTGISTRTVGAYTRDGLLRPSRDERGRPRYDPADVDRIVYIGELLAAGLLPRDVRVLLPALVPEPSALLLPDADLVAVILEATRARLHRDRDEIERQLDGLRHIERQLRGGCR